MGIESDCDRMLLEQQLIVMFYERKLGSDSCFENERLFMNCLQKGLFYENDWSVSSWIIYGMAG